MIRWLCPACNRLFRGPVSRDFGQGRYHNLLCDQPMRRVRIEDAPR